MPGCELTALAEGLQAAAWAPAGTYPGGSGHYSVGEDKEVQADQLEDVLEEVDDLQGQHILGTKETQGRGPAFSSSHDSWGPCPVREG